MTNIMIPLAAAPKGEPLPTIFFVALVACLAVAVTPSFLDRRISLALQRRIFWGASVAASLFGFLMLYSMYQNWKEGIGVALFFLGLMTFLAYFNSPYIKIGGKIYALTVQDSRAETPRPTPADPEFDPAPDAYSGIITAMKLWWMAVPGLAICAISAYFFIFTSDHDLWFGLATALLVVLALLYGYGDGSWGYRIARGQYVQFGIVAVVTAGSFTLLYLAAYWAGRRWPFRSRRSMERVHPRLRNWPQSTGRSASARDTFRKGGENSPD